MEVRRMKRPIGDAVVVLRRLLHVRAIFGHAHRAKLEHFDDLAIQAIATLLEEDGPFARGLDRNRRKNHRGGGNDEGCGAQHDVFNALNEAVHAIKRRLEDADQRDIAKRSPAAVEQVKDVEIGDVIDTCGGVREGRQEFGDALLGFHRKREVYALHLAATRAQHGLVEGANDAANFGRNLRQTIRRAVLEEADQAHAQLGRRLDALREMDSDVCHAHDGDVALIATLHTCSAEAQTRDDPNEGDERGCG